MMKLIKRLEMQSHNNLVQNPNFQNKVNTSEYQEQRKAFNEFDVPASPDQFLQDLKSSAVSIEDKVMPGILQLAKQHVEAVNLIHNLCIGQGSKPSESQLITLKM